MSSYLSCVDSAMPSADEFPQADAGFPAGMIAVRAAGVICPGGAATALLVAGSPVASGEPLVFAHPVTVAPAVVRRSGAVQAGGAARPCAARAAGAAAGRRRDRGGD